MVLRRPNANKESVELVFPLLFPTMPQNPLQHAKRSLSLEREVGVLSTDGVPLWASFRLEHFLFLVVNRLFRSILSSLYRIYDFKGSINF